MPKLKVRLKSVIFSKFETVTGTVNASPEHVVSDPIVMFRGDNIVTVPFVIADGINVPLGSVN